MEKIIMRASLFFEEYTPLRSTLDLYFRYDPTVNHEDAGCTPLPVVYRLIARRCRSVKLQRYTHEDMLDYIRILGICVDEERVNDRVYIFHLFTEMYPKKK